MTENAKKGVDKKLEQLEKYDTPCITNAVATYPNDTETCLGLYEPLLENWYCDETLKCMYPELGRTCGYVVTCVYGEDKGNFGRVSFADLLRAIDKAPKPVILAIKQNYPDELKKKNGLLGGNMMNAFKQCGVIGVLSDGPSRDIDEVRELGVQYMLTGAAAGHGDFELKAINVPVSICGMDIAPGEVVHMDESGATKFPKEYIKQVIDNCEKIQNQEKIEQSAVANAKDVEEIITIMEGNACVSDK